MSNLTIGRGEWVVVCDGQKALWLENVGDEKFPQLQTRAVHEQDVSATHEIGSDAPGRSFNSVGAGRSAVEQTDWHEQSESRFLEKLVSQLDAEIVAGRIKSLIIVAPPRALGIMRKAYSGQTRNALRAELDKDLVKMPVHEIERHLTH